MMKPSTIAAVLVGACLIGLRCDVTEEGFVVELTADRIQEKLDEAFPVRETYLMVLHLTLADPEVELTEGSDRIGFGLSAMTNVSVDGKDVTGRAVLSAGVKYDREKGALFLADPRVESFKMPILPEEYEDDVRLAARLVVTRYLKDYEVYRLNRSDLKERLAGMFLKDVMVQEGKVKLLFGPAER